MLSGLITGLVGIFAGASFGQTFRAVLDDQMSEALGWLALFVIGGIALGVRLTGLN